MEFLLQVINTFHDWNEIKPASGSINKNRCQHLYESFQVKKTTTFVSSMNNLQTHLSHEISEHFLWCCAACIYIIWDISILSSLWNFIELHSQFFGRWKRHFHLGTKSNNLWSGLVDTCQKLNFVLILSLCRLPEKDISLKSVLKISSTLLLEKPSPLSLVKQQSDSYLFRQTR